MPTTRKQQNKARKSREADMLSDIENLDILLGSIRLEREESEFSNSVRRPGSPSYNALVNHDVNSHSKSREDEIGGYAGQNSREVDSSSEIHRLSGELNQRITQEMNDLMSSVSSQIQRAISEASNEQVLPQIQTTQWSAPGQVPNRRWEVPDRRPQCRYEVALNRKFRSSSRDELPRDFSRNEDLENTHYKWKVTIWCKKNFR